MPHPASVSDAQVSAPCAAPASGRFATLTMQQQRGRNREVVDLANFLIACGAKIEGHGSSIIKVQGVPRLGGCEYRIMPDRGMLPLRHAERTMKRIPSSNILLSTTYHDGMQRTSPHQPPPEGAVRTLSLLSRGVAGGWGLVPCGTSGKRDWFCTTCGHAGRSLSGSLPQRILIKLNNYMALQVRWQELQICNNDTRLQHSRGAFLYGYNFT